MNLEPVIEVKNLSKSFGSTKVLDDISFNVYPNEFLQIIGFSGTGKSTLLRLICGLEEPDSGEVILRTQHIGMVFQGAALFDSMTVFDNIAFPLVYGDSSPSYEVIKAKVQEKLKLVGLPGIDNLMPEELSGGMKKRVSFARTVVNDPNIILYDEPTSGLDPVVSTVITNYILKLHQELNAVSILVTHSLDTIQRIKGRILLLYGSKFVFEGNAEGFFTTQDLFAKQFREGNPKGPMLIMKD